MGWPWPIHKPWQTRRDEAQRHIALQKLEQDLQARGYDGKAFTSPLIPLIADLEELEFDLSTQEITNTFAGFELTRNPSSRFVFRSGFVSEKGAYATAPPPQNYLANPGVKSL